MRAEKTGVLNDFITAVGQNVPSLSQSMQSLQEGEMRLSQDELQAVFQTVIKGQYLKPQKENNQEFLDAYHNYQLDAYHGYHKVRITQASLSFYAALALLVIGTFIVFVGIILLFTSNIQAGSVSLVSGTVSDIISILVLKFYGDSNNRLDQTAKGVDAQVAKEMAMLTTITVATDLLGRGEKEVAEELVRKIQASFLSVSTDR